MMTYSFFLSLKNKLFIFLDLASAQVLSVMKNLCVESHFKIGVDAL